MLLLFFVKIQEAPLYHKTSLC